MKQIGYFKYPCIPPATSHDSTLQKKTLSLYIQKYMFQSTNIKVYMLFRVQTKTNASPIDSFPMAQYRI